MTGDGRLLRRIIAAMALLQLLTAAVLAFVLFSGRDTEAVVTALAANQARLQALQAEQSSVFNPVLRRFFAQENYICSYLVVRGHAMPVPGLPTPPPGLCTVNLPGG